MKCAEIVAEYGAYALGIAEEPERSEIARHLARTCPTCTRGVQEALELTAAVSATVKMSDPPRQLRDRVVSMVAPQRVASQRVSPQRKKARWWEHALLPWTVAAALALALVVVIWPGGARPAASSKLEQALTILSDPALKNASFGQPSARGRVFVSPERGVVFVATNLPPLNPGKTFELWLIPPAGKPVPAGTFRSESNSVVYVRPGPADQAGAVAVTVEPDGGSPQPTTTPFIAAKL